MQQLPLPPADLAPANHKQACCLQLQVRSAFAGASAPPQRHPCSTPNPWPGTALTAARASQWDTSGDQLAALPAGSSSVFVWTSATCDLQKLDTEFRVRHCLRRAR